MNTPKHFQATEKYTFKCELERCPVCDSPIMISNNISGRKFVQTLNGVLRVGYRHGQCTNSECPTGYMMRWRSSQWQQLAPLHSSYGFDVIARIGWLRQHENMTFECIHQELSQRVVISEPQVRQLYYSRYLPLIACSLRSQWKELEQISEASGLILTLDGLAPEGGEPQLWVVRELNTGLALRSGWTRYQSQKAFENFLSPIASVIKARSLKISGIMSDKQRGLVPAVKTVFKGIPHGYCHAHYLKNLAEPVADADEEMKIKLRQKVREEVGELIRQEDEGGQPGVLTVTGLIPSLIEPENVIQEIEPENDVQGEKERLIKISFDVPQNSDIVEQSSKNPDSSPADNEQLTLVDNPTEVFIDSENCQKQEEVVKALFRRTRYLLTLKGRPPCSEAGIEMYERLTELSENLDDFISHYAEPRLVALQHGLKTALQTVEPDYQQLQQAGNWLRDISDLLDQKEDQLTGTGVQVKQELFDYLTKMRKEASTKTTKKLAIKMKKTTKNYAKGLFHTYTVATLPRTNNEIEGEFREYKRYLLRTTGQKGTTRRMIGRCGAWEILASPNDLWIETANEIAQVGHAAFVEERERVRQHRERFRLHTRSAKWIKTQFDKLKEIWEGIKPKVKPTTA